MSAFVRLLPVLRAGLAAVLLGSGSLALAAPAAGAAPTFALVGLSASASGTSVTATTTLRASPATTVTKAGVCARGSGGANADFPGVANARLTTSGTTITGARSLTPGTYTYFACLLYAGTWRKVGALKTLTVVDAPTRVPVQNVAALGRWHAGISARSTAPVRWVAIGESLTEGQGASTRDKRWLDKTRDNLRRTYPVAGVLGGLNYLPAVYRVYGPDSPWGQRYTSTGTVAPAYWTPDLGYRALQINPSGSASYSVTGTSADIWYVSGPGTGVLSYAVDAGSPVSVPTAGAYSASSRVQNVALGSAGTHTIRISASSAAIYLGGFTLYDGDRSAGVHIYDSGFSGATVATFLADKAQFHRTLAAVAPDLVSIELGVNDYGRGNLPATYKAQLAELLSDVKTLPKVPSILLMIPYEVDLGSTPAYPYGAYTSAMHDLAAADPEHVAAVDLSRLMPTTDSRGTGYYTTDALHPNDAGQQRMTDIFTSVLTQ